MTDARVRAILWLSYLFLLAVLLPHTAWAFAEFEQPGPEGLFVAGAAAVAFEIAIAGLTYRLSRAIEQSRRRRSFWRRYIVPILNPYSLGLGLALVVSAAANWAHAVEFGRDLAVFDRYGVPPVVYAVLFGGVLPVTSLLFAFVLANDVSADTNPELTALRAELAALRRQLRQADQSRQAAEARLGAAGDLVAALTGAEKRARILATRAQWPELPARAVAIIAAASPSYVSEVLNSHVDPE